MDCSSDVSLYIEVGVDSFGGVSVDPVISIRGCVVVVGKSASDVVVLFGTVVGMDCSDEVSVGKSPELSSVGRIDDVVAGLSVLGRTDKNSELVLSSVETSVTDAPRDPLVTSSVV